MKNAEKLLCLQVWFKNRRAKCRQQAKQQQSHPGPDKSRLLKQAKSTKSPPPGPRLVPSSPSGSPLSAIRESPFKLERSSPAGDPLMNLSGGGGGVVGGAASSALPSSSYNPIWSPAR